MTIQPSVSQNNFLDISKLAALFDSGAGTGSSFDDIFNEVASEDSTQNFLPKTDDSTQVYQQKSSDPASDQVTAKSQKDAMSIEDKLQQKTAIDSDKVTAATAASTRPLTAAQLDKAVSQILPIVPQIVATTFSQYTQNTATLATRHFYRLSDRLPIPLDIAFEQGHNNSIKVTLYSEGGLSSALVANSDDLLKQLKKSLKKSDIELSVQKSTPLLDENAVQQVQSGPQG